MSTNPTAEQYNQKHSESQTKFLMPIGWGWTYPFIKYTTIGLISIKMACGIPWMPFFICVAFSIRLLMLPLMVRQMVLIHRMAKVNNFK
jgi:membrane protein insertase Oxa1/YidC/SpoIIIJ